MIEKMKKIKSNKKVKTAVKATLIAAAVGYAICVPILIYELNEERKKRKELQEKVAEQWPEGYEFEF